MAYYSKPPELRTGVVQRTQFLGPALQPKGQILVAAPGWAGAQQGRTPIIEPRMWNRIPVRLVEGQEPIPYWDVLGNRGL